MNFAHSTEDNLRPSQVVKQSVPNPTILETNNQKTAAEYQNVNFCAHKTAKATKGHLQKRKSRDQNKDQCKQQSKKTWRRGCTKNEGRTHILKNDQSWGKRHCKNWRKTLKKWLWPALFSGGQACAFRPLWTQCSTLNERIDWVIISKWFFTRRYYVSASR